MGWQPNCFVVDIIVVDDDVDVSIVVVAIIIAAFLLTWLWPIKFLMTVL